MKNPLGLILILVGLALAVYGIMMFGDSGASVEALGVELGVQDKDMRLQSFLLIGLGALSLIGGVFVMRKK